MLGPGLVITALALSAGFTIFYLIKSRHLEAMARIEHGLAGEESTPASTATLTAGLFLTFLGMGVFFAYVIEDVTSIPDSIALPGSILLFGGLGLLTGYWLQRRMTK